MTTRAEAESVIRWDQETDLATFYTADEPTMRRWVKKGIPMDVYDTYKGEPTGWQGEGPRQAVRVRQIIDGEVKKRPMPAGHPFLRKHDPPDSKIR